MKEILVMEANAIPYVATQSGINAQKVIAVCSLLFKDQCTVPFIARYRKEVTGNLDEVQIRDIEKLYHEYVEMEKRRAYILDAITKMEKMTPELNKQIIQATTINQLEDIYAPYKEKKKTKAQIAKEKGIEPLAELMFTSHKKLSEMNLEIDKLIKESGGKIKDATEVINGINDIIIEKFAHDLEIKEKIRQEFWANGKMVTGKRKDAEEIKDFIKFKDFFEFTEPLKQLKDPKNTHRYLAMRRGLSLKVLKMDALIDENYPYALIQNKYFPKTVANTELLKSCAKKAYDQFIQPSMDLEVKTDLKKIADEAAIDVFGINLKNLLLQPYLGAKAVIGIDPGIRTGCKLVIIDATGKFIGDHVVYPFEPRNDKKGAAEIITKMIDLFKIEYIAIGNGTNGRETLEFVEMMVPQVKSGAVKATMISEAGASIYSASEVARKEFPDKDVTVRGAISIARRFQDPLAELVKIDPKSIGVGQYQHDVNQVRLKKSLEGVVEDCVNFVGVDLNTASAYLLSFISGIGASVAENIVKFRESKGGLKSRQDLLSIPRFTQKIFEQSAGFLRIYAGAHPLDSTFIHPEKYPVIENWTKKNKIELKDLLNDKDIQLKFEQDSTLAKEIGELTFKDIVKSLKAPVQDPRKVFKSVEFDKTIKTKDDLKTGTWYQGVITNITNFGAFVDIGIKDNGLLHVSEISHDFVENPLAKLKVGDEIKVKVLEVDNERGRISLTCKSDTKPTQGTFKNDSPKSGLSDKRPMPNSSAGNFKNNAFGGLKNFKV